MAAGYNPRFAWPIVIDSTNDQFTFNEGGGALVCDVLDSSTVVGGAYFWRGDGTAADMCLALKTALDTVGAHTYTVVLTTAGKLTISATGAFTLNWGTVAHDLPASLLGFVDADQVSVANACVSDFHVGNAWFVQQITVDDTEDTESADTVATRLENGRVRVAMYGNRLERSVTIDALPAFETYQAEEALAQRSFGRFWTYARTGGHFEYAPNSAVPGTYSSYQIADPTWLRRGPARLTPRVIRRYDVDFPMTRHVA